MRRIVSKIHQDIYNAPPARDVMRYLGSMIVGGNSVTNADATLRQTGTGSSRSNARTNSQSSSRTKPSKKYHVSKQYDEHALEIIHNLVWNFLNGTSVGVFKHFLQSFKAKKFKRNFFINISQHLVSLLAAFTVVVQ